ncbi:ABC-three component system middle component 1 [Vibrio parahaemolyticus]|uniref:ABC-three component system middle component 1 n=1 Tax=Vibrio parahaemolyticus TaxID=670 RepID=UPI00226A51BF|nr:ABC-three component system middle component 1 [Vibrio parahaemolyticus]MCX8763301.1 hypothetical protein [Vibrio parahaemolyticus]
MSDIYDRVMITIFKSLGFTLYKVDLSKDNYELELELEFYVASKNGCEYFVYLNLPCSSILSINNDIQIKVFNCLDKGMVEAEKIFGDDIGISSNFTKNSTMIVFSGYDDSLSNRDLNNIISIEEDPYFFKKQVVPVNSTYEEALKSCFEEHSDKYIEYLQSTISDTVKFNDFMKARASLDEKSALEYSFVSKLYEKLPFLILPVKKSSSNDLQEAINNQLSAEQISFAEQLLSLGSDDIDKWISELKGDNLNG